MENEIVAEVKLTHPKLRRYVYFHHFKKGRHFRPYHYMVFTLSTGGLIFSIYWFLRYGVQFTAIFLLAAAIFIVFYQFFHVNIVTNRLYENEQLLEQTAIYKFDQEKLFIDITGPKMSGTNETYYSSIENAYETKDCFYLYVSKKHTFIVPKSDLPGQSADTLSKLLKENLANRYVRCFPV